MSQRVAIVGTAQSWTQTPWNDPGLRILSLNDAYRMKGFQRADEWFDFHPPDKWWHPPNDQPVYAHQVPLGHYTRPSGHKEWLLTQAKAIPIYLHPSYRETWPEAANCVNAHPFPKAECEEYFGRYFTSSPAWMLAHAYLQGAREIHIYGIHLATEHEFIEQRPNFESLISKVLGSGKVKTSVKGEMRYYETHEALIALPTASPVYQSPFQYAFEPRPRQALDPLKWEAHKVQIKRERAIAQLKTARFWKRPKLNEEIARLDAWMADVQEQVQRVQAQIG